MPSKDMEIQSHYNLIQKELVQVRQVICEQFQSSDDQISSVLEVLSQQQGKMIRPAMVLLCSKLFGGIRQEHIEFSAMVELIHMASLLHDDVIDKAQLRRGQPSANALWGNTAAVLLGDFLLSRAFMLAAASECEGAATLLGQTAQVLCIGELKQNLFKGRFDLNEQDYFQMIEAKTAALFRCSCERWPRMPRKISRKFRGSLVTTLDWPFRLPTTSEMFYPVKNKRERHWVRICCRKSLRCR
jgi:octaprenyl-diphosphate synthase